MLKKPRFNFDTYLEKELEDESFSEAFVRQRDKLERRKKQMGHVRRFLVEAGIAEDFCEEICSKLYEGVGDDKFVEFIKSKGFSEDFAKEVLRICSAC